MNVRILSSNCCTFLVLIASLLIGLVNSNSTIAQTQPEVGAKPTGLATPIKVMSFNIRYGTANDGVNHWNERSELVAETIEMFDPDLLGLQEVVKFQAEFLQEKLPEYGFHGVGRDDGAAKGEYVPLMYKKDRFEIDDSGHFWLSETPDVAGSKSWDSSLPRMVSWVQLIDLKNNNSRFVFLNTHFDHRGKTARLESARLIRKRAEEIMGQGMPVIVTGDFNTTEDDQPYAEMTSGNEKNKTSIFDSFRAANPDRGNFESTFSSWNGKREGTRIDWILHSKEFSTLQSVINYTHDGERYPSDHYPVQSVVRLKN